MDKDIQDKYIKLRCVKRNMESRLSKILEYTIADFTKKFNIIEVFAIPMIFAFLIPVFVAAPSYLAIGGIFLRTGSIPDLSVLDIALSVIGYIVSLFLISVSVVNINLTIKSKRTQNSIKDEVILAMQTYAIRIFAIYTVMLILSFALQVLTYESSIQKIVYPLTMFIISLITFYVAPAIVIDDCGILNAIEKSIKAVSQTPLMVLSWIIVGFLALALTKLISDLIFGSFSGYVVLLVNSLLVLPFLIVFQTHLYMEKYPLAR